MPFPKGGHHSPETRAKMRGVRGPRHDSEEVKKHLSVVRKAQWEDPVYRAKVAAVCGRKRGPRYKQDWRHYRAVYEEAWGCIPVDKNGRTMRIHHRDGDRDNDSPENLIALTHSEHRLLHAAWRREDWEVAAVIEGIGFRRRG